MISAFSLVEHRGFEPLTSTLRTLRATNCANAPYFIACAHKRKRNYSISKAKMQWVSGEDLLNVGVDRNSHPSPQIMGNVDERMYSARIDVAGRWWLAAPGLSIEIGRAHV